MKQIEVEAKTVEEAVEMALQRLGVKREEVEIEIINEGKMGLFGLMGATPAKIKATLKDEKSYAPVNNVLAKAETIVVNMLTEILSLMGINSEIKTVIDSGKIVAEIKSSEGALLIGKRGQTLDALQFIIKILVNKEIKKQCEDDRIKIILDTEGYRQKRETALNRLAKEMAEKVKETRIKQETEPMNPQDRRIVHIAIGDDPELDVISEGDGVYKKMVVRCKK